MERVRHSQGTDRCTEGFTIAVNVAALWCCLMTAGAVFNAAVNSFCGMAALKRCGGRTHNWKFQCLQWWQGADTSGNSLIGIGQDTRFGGRTMGFLENVLHPDRKRQENWRQFSGEVRGIFVSEGESGSGEVHIPFMGYRIQVSNKTEGCKSRTVMTLGHANDELQVKIFGWGGIRCRSSTGTHT